MDISDALEKNRKIKIVVRPNASKTEIVGYDKEKKGYRMNVKALPEKNRANLEIISFFRKRYKFNVRILRGIKSKEKILELR